MEVHERPAHDDQENHDDTADDPAHPLARLRTGYHRGSFGSRDVVCAEHRGQNCARAEHRASKEVVPGKGLRLGCRGANVRSFTARTRQVSMAKFLFKASLSPEGVAGVMAEGGTARRAVVKKALESLGGTLESFYFAFGDDDVVVICELPDNQTAAAFAMETSASGRVAVSTSVLLTPEEVDGARGKKSGWRAPGG
jgi:uncharacterized protein with GYD domain